MVPAAHRRRHEQWLLEVTGLPTAAGREHRVIAWATRFCGRRKDLRLATDPHGNLVITQKRRSARQAIWITAHLDHPAFVVRSVLDERHIELEFRGGVANPYFEDAEIEVFDDQDTCIRGLITKLDADAKPFKRVTARVSSAKDIVAGDVGRWHLGNPAIRRGHLHAPACDDLAGVVSALAALDEVRAMPRMGHVGVLLTRAEEIGFVGAIAAAKGRTIPRGTRLLCLETSRSYVESPIGAGPILRVGDKASVFGPTLTNAIARIMDAHAAKESFHWQRKLMPGGTCEATAFSEYGYQSTCLCLPLGNYHNQGDIDGVVAGKRPARVACEVISVSDFHGLVEMLLVTCRDLDSPQAQGALRKRLDGLLQRHRNILT